MKPPTTGIIERIKSANSADQVKSLLKELGAYKHVSPQTVRRAHKQAAKWEVS